MKENIKTEGLTSKNENIVVGISSCLLGEAVRYDGGHKENSYIKRTLGQIFTFIPFCPEVAIGLGVPRPTLNLVEKSDKIRCVGVKDTTYDVTDKLVDYADKEKDNHSKLCAYIFKKGSPSCGIENVKIYKNKQAIKTGSGIYAEKIIKNLPALPVEDEEKLGDPLIRENFIHRVFVMHHWHLLNNDLSVNSLSDFHLKHKLIFMAHNPSECKILENLMETLTNENLIDASQIYIIAVMNIMKSISTIENHLKVLKKIQSVIKRDLSIETLKQIDFSIDKFRLKQVPLIVPVSLLKYHLESSPNTELAAFYYLNFYYQASGNMTYP